jgi:hypothetical protein
MNNTISTLLSSLNSFPSSFSGLDLQKFIRLASIIGGYILLRPYIELGFRKLFATQKEQDSDTVAPEASKVPPSKINPAGGISAEATIGRTGWGAAARKRREMILQAWEEEQARLAEERDLDGIDPDLLED